MPIDYKKTPLTIEQAKKTKQIFQKSLEDGDVIPAKSLITEQIENVSDESGSYQDKPFIFQATGTNSNTTEAPTAPIAKHLELRGNTVVFNQLVNTGTTEIIPVVKHKYLTMISGVKSIVTAIDDTPIEVTDSTDNVFDLTLMFGRGNEPASVVEFNRLFSLPYYDYNAGQLMSCVSTELVTTGYNQFSTLDEFIRVVAGQTYRVAYYDGTELKPLTSGSIVEYDGSQTQLKTTSYSELISLHTIDSGYPDNGDNGILLTDETQYVKIINSSNTNILLNIAWDGSRFDYESFVRHQYTLPSWADGKSAGSAYDSYYHDGTIIRRVGTVDLGELTWTKVDNPDNQGHYLYYSDVQTDFKATAADVKTNIVCSRYLAGCYFNTKWGYYGDYYNIGNCIALYNNNNRFYVYDAEFDNESATAAQLETSLSGVVAYVELAESIITTGQQTFPENVEVDDFGTMLFVSRGSETAGPVVAQGNQFFYPADYVLLMDDLNRYTNGDVQSLLKNTQIKAGGTALVPDANGNVNIPISNYTTFGVFKVGGWSAYEGVKMSDGGEGILQLGRASNSGIDTRTPTRGGGYGAIDTRNFDYAVKAAMTDDIGLAWTDAEKAAARSRMGVASVISGVGAPTSSTEGILGQIYIDTTNHIPYMCVGIDSGTYTWVAIAAVSLDYSSTN